MSRDDVLAWVWRQQSVWSKTAGMLKAEISQWRMVVLAGLVAGAVLETLAFQFESGSGPQRALALAGAAALAVVPVVRSTKVNRDGIVNWTRARSVSEALKQEVYGYCTGTVDYRNPDTRSEALRANVDRMLDEAEDLTVITAQVEAAHREPPGAMSVAEYLDARVREQVAGYYRPKARELAVRAQRLRSVELALAITGVLVGAASGVFGSASLAGWVAVATTISGAVVAHREASRYEHLVIAYSTTARRLEALDIAWSERLAAGPLTAEQEDELVAKCEDAISVENQAWMASWARSPLG